MKINNQENHLFAYRQAAIEHGKAIISGKSIAANKQYHELYESFLKLKEHPRAPIQLMDLLNDKNDSVASWAATHLIRFCTPQAIATLERIASKDDIIAFDARMVIEEWNKGRFKGEEW